MVLLQTLFIKMLTNIIIFLLCIMRVVMEETKVCTKNEWYIRTSISSYLDLKDHIIKSHIVSNWETRNVYTCCAGYRKVLNDSEWSSFSFDCEPICEPACPVHKYCESPGICSCLPGYIEDLSSKEDLCRPLCTECDYRHCIAPGVCARDLKIESKIECAGCENGECAPPGKCVCNKGYRFDNNNTCKPYCSKDCGNGYCASPEICQCRSGWYEVNPKDLAFLCAPICDYCEGNCVAPNECIITSTKVPTTDNHSFKELKLTSVSMTTHFETKTSASGILQPDGLNLTQSKKVARETSWMEKHGVSILIPVVLVLIATLVMVSLLLWHRTSIMVFFRARYYVVDGHLPVETKTSPQVYYAKNSEHTDWKNIELSTT